MDKLIEISIKGSTYYFINCLSQNEITNLQEFSKEFYASNPVHSKYSEETILNRFVSEVHKTFGIALTRIPISAVLVIK